MTVVPKTFKLVEEGTLTSQGTYSQILMTNFNLMGWRGGGGFQQRFIFYTQKIATSEFVYPRNSLLFSAYPKKSLSPFLQLKRIPLVFFHDPKKILASFIDPKKITQTPPPPCH